MIEKRTIKLFQIAASNGYLFGLDGQGRLWRHGPITNPNHIGWVQVETPEEEVKIKEPRQIDQHAVGNLF